MPRYFLEVKYDGTAFHGSQLQGDTPTVQLAINYSLSTLLREPIASFGASRTDEGVHAICNFYHFDTEIVLHDNFLYKLNAILPPAISLSKLYLCNNPELNARFDATTRRYRYKIYNKKNPFLVNRALYYPLPVDENVLQQTAALLKQYEDFESFAKRKSQTFTFNCRIYQSYWERQGDELHYIVEANRFLRGMVRGLVGTQLQAGRGRIDIAGFKAIIEAKDCTKADFSVTGNGLYLEHIQYPEGSLTEIQDKY